MLLRRREFIALLGGAASAWPLAARAQQAAVRRIGVLMNGTATDPVRQSYLPAFVQGLRQLGWTEGQNLRIDVRWSAADVGLARIYAAQLIGLMPDVILTASTINLTVVQQATTTVPIIFTAVSDPVAQGFVANLTHPGGNLTGFSDNEFSMGGKWVGLLKQAAPGLARVAVMFNPDVSPQTQFYMRSIEAAAPSFGIQAIAVPVRAPADIQSALESFSRQPNGGLILPTDSFTRLRQKQIAELAVRHGLPSISAYDDFPKDGGLMFYGSNVNLATCRSNYERNSRSASILGPPRRSASPCPPGCSPSSRRSSNEAARIHGAPRRRGGTVDSLAARGAGAAAGDAGDRISEHRRTRAAR
jgi:putative ABC transport system substrate-binding protein